MKVTYHGQNVHIVGDVTLIPGINEVQDEAWKQAEKNPGVQEMLKKKTITLGDAPAETSSATTEARIREAQGTLSPDRLEAMRAGETDPGVLAAIDQQLAKIKPPTGQSSKK